MIDLNLRQSISLILAILSLMILSACNLNAPDDTPTPIGEDGETCNPISGWVSYEIQRGDVLSRLAQSVGVTVDELAAGNCLENPNQLTPGEFLRLPRLPGTFADCNDTLLPEGQGADFVSITPSRQVRPTCLALTRNSTVTVTWDNAPIDSVEVTFYRVSDPDQFRPDVIGVDDDGSDGFSIQWTVMDVPPSVLYATALGPTANSDYIGIFVAQ